MKEIKKIIKKIFKNKKIVSFFVLFLIVGVFFVGSQVRADGTGTAVEVLLGWIIFPLVTLIGKIITLLLYIFGAVASYNDFINATPVTTGWVIVRDLCNMFFILILLVIAFATILRVEGYDIKKMVPKLIIMAILINFSKTICGLIIDAAAIIMNTFVNAFQSTIGSGFATMLGLPDLLSMNTQSGINNQVGASANGLSVLGSLILALVLALISLVVVVVLLAVLVVRMVMIWIYIVLSPLAYLLATFPQGQRYAKQWWDDFTKYVITGPILAFFIWLALISASAKAISFPAGQSPQVGDTGFGTPETMLRYIISIGMLVGGLIITQQAGGAIGGIAGAGMAKINGGAKWLQGKATKSVKQTAQLTGAGALGLASKGVSRLGNVTNSKSLQSLGKVGGLASAGIQKSIADEKRNDRMKTLKKFGLGRAEDQEAVQALSNSALGRGVKTAGRVGVGALTAVATGGLSAVPAVAGVGFGLGYAGYHVASEISSRGAKKKADDYNNEPKALEKTRDNEISVAGDDLSVKIKPFELQRDTEIKNAETEKNNTVNTAEIDRERALDSIKISIRNADPAFTGKEETHPSFSGFEQAANKQYDDTKKFAESRLERKTATVNRDYEKAIAPHQQVFQQRESLAKANYQSSYAQTEKGRREVQKNNDISNIKADPSLAPDVKKTRIDEVETKYRQADKNLSSGVKENDSEARRKRIAGYHPNKVTMDASKEIGKIEDNAKKFAEAIAHGAEFLKSSSTAFYSTNGQNDGQKANIKSLAGNTEALAGMVKELRASRMSNKALTATDKKLVKNFKQGLASTEKGNGDISNFRRSGVIDEIENSAWDGEGEDHATVDGLKAQVI
jgi:hypothetical protein